MLARLLDRAAPAVAPAVAVMPRERTWAMVAETAAIVMAAGWAVTFGYLSLARHLSGGSHAEDLGFTDQVLWNSLHGHPFHMSIYAGAASWNTELDLSRMLRPDSLLAFHFEPMLLGLVPLYALGGMHLLLALQAAAVALGAIPAFRIGRHLTSSPLAALAVAAAYLLSPFGQWAVLADFHTSALAAPLLVFAVDRFVVARNHFQAFVLAAVAVTAREDVAAVVAVLGLSLLLRRGTRGLGTALTVLGALSTAVALAVIQTYSDGVSPFEVRYGSSLADPVAALTRSEVVGYLGALLLSGAWLAVFAPVALLPALPSLVLNAFSSSPWMASGQAHYSALVLPFVTIAACFALARARHWPSVLRGASLALAAASLVSYTLAGAGPLAANYAPAMVTEHALAATSLAASLPSDAAVSASSALVPRISQRARAYVFPAVLDADYVFLDLQSSPAPTSAGDLYLRVRALLASGEWHIAHNADGLVLLAREAALPPSAAQSTSPAVSAQFASPTNPTSLAPTADSGSPTNLTSRAPTADSGSPTNLTSRAPTADSGSPTSLTSPAPSEQAASATSPRSPAPSAQAASPTSPRSPAPSAMASPEDPSLPTSSASLSREDIPLAASGSTPEALRPALLAASLIPSPDAAIDTDGPHWILRTTWQAQQPLPSGTRPRFWITLTTGETLERWDIADLWWNPPDHWPIGQPITIDVPDVPHNAFASWSATWSQS